MHLTQPESQLGTFKDHSASGYVWAEELGASLKINFNPTLRDYKLWKVVETSRMSEGNKSGGAGSSSPRKPRPIFIPDPRCQFSLEGPNDLAWGPDEIDRFFTRVNTVCKINCRFAGKPWKCVRFVAGGDSEDLAQSWGHMKYECDFDPGLFERLSNYVR